MNIKRSIITLLMGFFAILSFAQESVRPTYGIDLERRVSIAEIDGNPYRDVTVEIKAAEITDVFVEGVKVIVRDRDNKKVYKKRFSKSRLYAFSDGTIQIGKGNALTNMSIFKDKVTGDWCMILREKGIY